MGYKVRHTHDAWADKRRIVILAIRRDGREGGDGRRDLSIGTVRQLAISPNRLDSRFLYEESMDAWVNQMVTKAGKKA